MVTPILGAAGAAVALWLSGARPVATIMTVDASTASPAMAQARRRPCQRTERVKGMATLLMPRIPMPGSGWRPLPR